jgi:PAS domain-containing protein
MTPDITHALAAALDQSGVAVGLLDANDQLRYANPAFLDAFAVEPGALPTWEEMMRSCHRHRRGLLIETDDIDA